MHVVLRPDDLAVYGISREFVADFVQTALKGEAVSKVLEGQRRFDLVIKLQEPYRSDPDFLKELRLELPERPRPIAAERRGRLSRGGQRAEPGEPGERPPQADRPLQRDGPRPGRGDRGNRAEGQASKFKLPEGYFIEFGGQFEAQRSATLLIASLAGVSLAGIFVVLMMLYPSARITFQILNAIPTAFIGGVLALMLTEQTLTVASLVGFVSLGGIAVRNGILLVTHYFHLMKEEGQEFSQATILRGSLERLAPVLMTALTAGIGLVPLVVGGKKPGLEILYPVATVILGGLVTSTFCEFLLHPGLFWKFSGKDAERLVQTEGFEADLLREM